MRNKVSRYTIYFFLLLFFVHLLPSSGLLLVVACMPCALLGAIHLIKKKDRKKENLEAKTNLKKLCLTLPADDSNFIWI